MRRELKIISVSMLLFLASSIVSLILCSNTHQYMHFGSVNGGMIWPAIFFTAAMSSFIPAFLLARFSFGYIVSFSLFSAVTGFLWLSFFSVFDYPREVARWSMVGALAAAVIPLLFMDRRIIWRPELSVETIRLVVWAMVCVATTTLVADLSYGFSIAYPVGPTRNEIIRPTLLNYLNGIIIAAVIPYLFTYFANRQRYFLAATMIGIGLCYYPVLLNKTILLLAIGLPFLFLIFGRFEARLATVLTLLTPLLVGFLFYSLANGEHTLVLIPFDLLNLRLLAIPSIALDHYSDFFAHHDLTNFCQVSIIRRLVGCPYPELGIALAEVYHDGNFNASFLATEGIASVGLKLAPISALICGIVLSTGSMASRHLSPQFVATSAYIAVPAVMNIPLTTALLSNGLAMLFLLWWITPGEKPNPV